MDEDEILTLRKSEFSAPKISGLPIEKNFKFAHVQNFIEITNSHKNIKEHK